VKKGNKLVSTLKEYPLAVLCAVVILVCAVLIFLRAGVIPELSAKEADLTSRIRTIDQNVKNAKDLGEEVEAVKTLVDQVDSRLFNRDQRAVNINFFYSLEDRLDVRISNIGQMPGEDSVYAKGGAYELKLHSTISYNIALEGTYDDILAFLYELHRVDPLIRVAEVQIASGKRNADDGILEARLRVLVLAEKD